MLSDRPQHRFLTEAQSWLGTGGEGEGPEPTLRRTVLAMITDARGRLAFVNRDLLAIGGWRWPEIAGRPWHEVLVAPDARDRARRAFEASIAGEQGPVYIEAPLLGADGGRRTIAWSSTATLDEYGNLLTVTSVGIDVSRWAEERDRLAAQREFEASHDPLTGLINNATFRFQLGVELAAARERVGDISVLLVGIDRFRAVIETLGHEAGDRLLREVAGRITAAVDGATVARWSGDEFAVMLGDVAGPEDALALAQRIVEAMTPPCTSCETEFHLGASVGVVIAPQDGDTPTTLMRNAACAMRHGKAAGGHRHTLFQASLSSEARERMILEQQLHGALARHEIAVVFQPQVDARSHRIVGAEALARWQNPLLGEVPPGRFIPLAEEAGMIVQLGRFVLHTAMVQAARWRAEGLPEITIAVNVSAHQIADGTLVDDVRRILEETETPARLLELEVTETAAMTDIDTAAATLRSLSALGVTISLDDFGTGYSCLGKLNHLSVSTIKIDRSFLGGDGGVANPEALVRALVALGRGLNLRIIAEGVETHEQLERLCNEGLDAYQGFLFAKPMPASEVRDLLRSNRPLG